MMPCIFFGLCGLLLGSFLNVCIVRLPAGESVARPRSHCRACKAPIVNRDNIPVLSWLLLRGACRACGAAIPWRYPAVEGTTCVLFIMCCLHFSSAWYAAGWALLCFLLLGLAVMDAETLLLPDLFTVPGLGAGILFAGFRGGLKNWNSTGNWSWATALRAMEHSILAAAAAASVLLLISGAYWLARRRTGMGLGDVKLIAMLAAWLGVPQTALILFLAVIVGSLYGIATVVLYRRARQAADQNQEKLATGEDVPMGQLPIPFGTMLCLAGLYSLFLGQRTLSWYGHFFR